MPLTVVQVAFPLAEVRPDAAGGAEQIISLLDRELVRRGHRSIVIACDGSSVAGELVRTPRPAVPFTGAVLARAWHHHRRALVEVLSQTTADIVHVHGHDFDRYLPPPGVPVLATLHLPPELALSDPVRVGRPDTWHHGVSWTQHARLSPHPQLLPPIENGVAVDELRRRVARRRFALVFGRICPEKGFHLAIAAARRSGSALLIGGTVFSYIEHRRYFENELVPQLDSARRYVGPLSMLRRRRLLNSARCVLVPSLVAETSSLVAMEALACGTPVVARRVGALPEIVEHGVTGLLADSVDEMAGALDAIEDIDPERCHQAARARFTATRTAAAYFERYEWMLAHRTVGTMRPRGRGVFVSSA